MPRSLSLVDVVIAGYLAFALVWPLVWDRFPRASTLLRKVGLFHRWDMMLAPGRELVSSFVLLAYEDGSLEQRPLPANDIYRQYLANKVAMDPSYAKHVLGVAMRGIDVDEDRSLTEVKLIVVEHLIPPMGARGAVVRTEHVVARAGVA